METRTCKQCGQVKDVKKFGSDHISGYPRVICKACAGDRERARLKLEMLNAFNRKCECCGEMHPEFLSLEHRIPGNSHGATGLQSHQLYRIARKEGWDKDKYACLCMNCNYAKGHVGYCPHQSSLSIDNWYRRYEYFAHHSNRLYGPATEFQKTTLALGPKMKSMQARANWEEQMKLKAENPDYYRLLSSKKKKALRRQTYRYREMPNA